MWLVYILKTIGLKIVLFLKHWYIDGFWFAYKNYMFVMRMLDREWALFVTVKHLFKPLYQDYSFAGYFIGIGFRIVRSIMAFFIYLVITVIFIFLYLVWCGILPVLVFKSLNR